MFWPQILLELQVEACQTTELQVILLLCWRSNLDKATVAARASLMERAQQHFKSIRSMSTNPPSTLRNQGSLIARIWWSYQIIQITSASMPFHDVIAAVKPPVVRPPSSNDFELEWLFSSRARIWYNDLDIHQALVRHLQQVSCFCKKSELYAKLGDEKRHLAQKSSRISNQPESNGESSLPLSQLFWTANDLDTEVEAILKARNLQIDLYSKDDVTVWSGRVHYIDLTLLYRITSFSLLWSEKLSMDSKLPDSPSTPGHKVAKDLIKTKIVQLSISISRIVGTLCYHRLSLLAHNVNPHILANLSAIANALNAETGKKTDEALSYGQLGAIFGYSICKYREIISMQSTSLTSEVNLESAFETIVQYSRAQTESLKEISTTAATPATSEPVTPANTDPFRIECLANQYMDKNYAAGVDEMVLDPRVIVDDADDLGLKVSNNRVMAD